MTSQNSAETPIARAAQRRGITLKGFSIDMSYSDGEWAQAVILFTHRITATSLSHRTMSVAYLKE